MNTEVRESFTLRHRVWMDMQPQHNSDWTSLSALVVGFDEPVETCYLRALHNEDALLDEIRREVGDSGDRGTGDNAPRMPSRTVSLFSRVTSFSLAGSTRSLRNVLTSIWKPQRQKDRRQHYRAMSGSDYVTLAGEDGQDVRSFSASSVSEHESGLELLPVARQPPHKVTVRMTQNGVQATFSMLPDNNGTITTTTTTTATSSVPYVQAGNSGQV